MSEIKMKSRNLFILISIFFIILFFISITNLKCDKLPSIIVNKQHNLKTIFAITPTYARPTQKAELTR